MLTSQLAVLGVGMLKTLVEKAKSKKKEVKMCVIGLDNAGVTTILKALFNQETQTVMPTQGFNVQSLSVGNL